MRSSLRYGVCDVTSGEVGALREATGWQKTKYEFLLYRVVEGAPDEPSFDLNVWPRATEITTYTLGDEGWPAAVTLFQFTTQSFPDDIDVALKSALEAASVSAHVRACWLMFEGGFMDIHALFDDPLQVYGLGSPGERPMVALTAEERRSRDWCTAVQGVARSFYSVFRTPP